MTDALSKEREAFDKWAGNLGYVIVKHGDGRYCYSNTDSAWVGWQARAALSADTPVVLKAENDLVNVTLSGCGPSGFKQATFADTPVADLEPKCECGEPLKQLCGLPFKPTPRMHDRCSNNDPSSPTFGCDHAEACHNPPFN